MTTRVAPKRLPETRPVRASHSRTVPSNPDAASVFHRGQATLQTWPMRPRSGSPRGSVLSTSHSRTVPAVRRGERPPIGAEGDADDLVGVPGERPSELLARRDVPQPHRPVGAAGRERPAVGTVGDGHDRAAVALQRRMRLLEAAYVPQAHGIVRAGEGDGASVRAERDASDSPDASVDGRAERALILDVPEPDGPVEARRCQRSPVAAEGQPQTSCACARNGRPSGTRAFVSQSRTVPSKSAEASVPPSGLYAIVRTPSAPPRRVASAPERREASSAATVAFDASALELARIASSPSSRELGVVGELGKASDASASEVADRVAVWASLRWTSAQVPRAANTAARPSSTPPTRTNRRKAARRRRSCSYSRRHSRLGSARTSWKSS